MKNDFRERVQQRDGKCVSNCDRRTPAELRKSRKLSDIEVFCNSTNDDTGLGASALTVPTTLTTDVEINNNVLEVCAAGASAKWGAVFADLSKESMIRVVNSKVIQCGCSLTMGRGGGLYLALKYSGEQ